MGFPVKLEGTDEVLTVTKTSDGNEGDVFHDALGNEYAKGRELGEVVLVATAAPAEVPPPSLEEQAAAGDQAAIDALQAIADAEAANGQTGDEPEADVNALDYTADDAGAAAYEAAVTQNDGSPGAESFQSAPADETL